MQTFEHRVKMGALFLDRKDPDWFRKIDINILNMNHATDGIIGQLTGFFGRDPYMISHKKYEKFGFDISDDELLEDYIVLKTLWSQEILKRLNVDL